MQQPDSVVKIGGVVVKGLSKLLIALMAVTLLFGCNNENVDKQIVDASFIPFTYSELLNESDIIAEVKIHKKISEFDFPILRTVFEAELLDVYKPNNVVDKKINIAQMGTSKIEFKDYKLFNAGEKLILFLAESKVTKEIEGAYIIVGPLDGTLYIDNLNNEDYVKKEIVPFPEFKELDKEEVKNKLKNDYKNKNLLRQVFKKDELKRKIISDLERR